MPINKKPNGTGSRPPRAFRQRHFTVRELATLWKLNSKKLQKLFSQQTDVIRLDGQLSIPSAVAERVHGKLLSSQSTPVTPSCSALRRLREQYKKAHGYSPQLRGYAL